METHSKRKKLNVKVDVIQDVVVQDPTGIHTGIHTRSRTLKTINEEEILVQIKRNREMLEAILEESSSSGLSDLSDLSDDDDLSDLSDLDNDTIHTHHNHSSCNTPDDKDKWECAWEGLWDKQPSPITGNNNKRKTFSFPEALIPTPPPNLNETPPSTPASYPLTPDSRNGDNEDDDEGFTYKYNFTCSGTEVRTEMALATHRKIQELTTKFKF